MKKLKWALFIAYCLFIVYYTLITRFPKATHTVDFRLFWSYRDLLAGKPTGKTDVIQNINNILFFIPFGLLFPAKKWWKTLLAAMCLSVAVEASQYFFGLGLCELDDVISNTIGAMIGYWLWNGLTRVMRTIDETGKKNRVL